MKVLKIDWLTDRGKGVLYMLRDRMCRGHERRYQNWLEAAALLAEVENPLDAIRVLSELPRRRPEYPLYLMRVEGKESLMPMNEAAATFDNGFIQVEIGDTIVETNCVARAMQETDRACIVDAADEYSASK